MPESAVQEWGLLPWVMTRAEIIADICKQVKPAPSEEEFEDIAGVLQRRLPDGVDIKTCQDFKYLGVECCEVCHYFYTHYEMNVIDLPEGGKAWVCDAVRWAIYPEEKSKILLGEKLLQQIFGVA